MMFKAFPLGASLVCMAALIGAGTASAGAVGNSTPLLAQQPTAIRAVASVTTTFPGLDFSQWLAPVGAVIGLQPANASSDVSASFVPAGGSSATAWLDADGDNHDRDHDNYRDRDRDRDHDRDRDPDHDHDRDHGRPHSPSPTPEPSTLLSFGTAIIIGGGVFFLGRLRKVQK